MFVSGLKDAVQAAYAAKQFSSTGKTHTEIDFSAPVLVEVTGLDTLGLVKIMKIEDDEVQEYGQEFTRTLDLQMIPDTPHQDSILRVLRTDPKLRQFFTGVQKVRVTLTGFIAAGKTYRKKEKDLPTDPRGAGYRKLHVEHQNFNAHAFVR
jgi:hypothetical protein